MWGLQTSLDMDNLYDMRLIQASFFMYNMSEAIIYRTNHAASATDRSLQAVVSYKQR